MKNYKMLLVIVAAALLYLEASFVLASNVSVFILPDISSSFYKVGDNVFAEKSKGECTWYVYGRVKEVHGIDLKFYDKNGKIADSGRDAYMWDSLLDANYSRLTAPVPGAIAVWKHKTKNFGHVAYVEHVYGGVVHYTEANFSTYGTFAYGPGTGGGYDGKLKHHDRDDFENNKGGEQFYNFIGYVLPSNTFDGEWHSPRYNYSFRIKSNSGIATLSNAPQMYEQGDVMLKIGDINGNKFTGTQIYANGQWYPVQGELINSELLRMAGTGLTWDMVKK